MNPETIWVYADSFLGAHRHQEAGVYFNMDASCLSGSEILLKNPGDLKYQSSTARRPQYCLIEASISVDQARIPPLRLKRLSKLCCSSRKLTTWELRLPLRQ